ncbi:MAG: serine/threonine protein kinase [Lentisphaeraceae bacterium]|nr:serine/threonine protein kinase [Lentisphaeraceae bacterium]
MNSESSCEFYELPNFQEHFNEALMENPADLLLYTELCEESVDYGPKTLIGKGGMKEVYRCREHKSARMVAMATLKESSTLGNYEKFIREARITASLEHPNIIPIYDVGVNAEEVPYFTMKLVKGLTLTEYCQQRDVSTVKLIQVFIKICDAIAYAHSRNVVHLDLKPDNIQLDEFGEVLVCDWGLAKIINQTETTEELYLDPVIYNDFTLDGIIKGSPGYLAPEQISSKCGDKDEKTDVFNLGGILYFMLTGKAPFQSSDIQESIKHTLAGAFTDPSCLQAVNQSLQAVCLKALSVGKNNRYKSVASLKKELDMWLQGFTTGAEDAGFLKSMLFLFKRHKAISLMLSLIVVLSTTFLTKNYYAEKRAHENQLLYLEQKAEKELIGKADAPYLIGLGQLALHNSNFDEALNYANLAVRRDSENKDGWLLKCKTHFFRQEFDACLKLCAKFGEGTYSKINYMSKQFIKVKSMNDALLPIAECIDIIRMFPSKYGSKKIFEYACQKAPNLQYLTELSLFYHQEVEHPKIKTWHVKYSIGEETIDLDLSGNRKMTSLEALRYLPISKLNVSETSIKSLDCMIKMPLTKLDISHTKILDSRGLSKIKSLTEVVFGPELKVDPKFIKKRSVTLTRR